MRVYISAPFTKKMKDKKFGLYGEIHNDHKSFLEDLETTIKSEGFSTFLPHRDISNWGSDPNLDLCSATKQYFSEISSSDIFIAYPENSRGVHMELGWALSQNKRILLIFENNFDLGTVIPGLKAFPNVNFMFFNTLEEMKLKIREYLKKL